MDDRKMQTDAYEDFFPGPLPVISFEKPNDKIFHELECRIIGTHYLVTTGLLLINKLFPCEPGYRWCIGDGGLVKDYWGPEDRDDG